MNCAYKDIRDRISEEPKWWDENAVPRYVEFHPEHAANIYARQCALVEIACQSCARRFKVCFVFDSMDLAYKCPTLSDAIKDGSLHYGDPPNVDCCPAGSTMNCNDVRVLQFWDKSEDWEWKRVPGMEVKL